MRAYVCTETDLTNRHTGGHSVRVHDDVRHDAFARERHVLLSERHTHSSFLTVTRGKLVADLRRAHLPQPNLDDFAIFFLVIRNHHLIDGPVGILLRDGSAEVLLAAIAPHCDVPQIL